MTAFEKMRGQNHVKKYMKKGDNSRMGEIFKYEIWCKKTKIKDTNPKKSIEINWEMAELLRVTTKKSYNIEEETIEKQYGVPLKTENTN